MALAAVVLLFVVGRLLVVTSTGHLLFHLDSAEYGILRGIRLYLDGSTLDVLLDANTRLRFGLSTTLVADTGLHGTLVLAGLLLHFVVTTFDAPIATHTLRVLAVCVSTTALVVWLRVLWRAFPKSSVPVYYALLVLAAPPMLWKLSVLFWGTHELVLFLHALMLLAFAGWVGKPSETVQSAVLRSLALGAVGAVAMAANTSLALPAAMLGLWVAGEAVWHARERVGRAALLGGVFAVGGIGALVGAWTGLVSVEALDAMGLEQSLFANDKLEQVAGASSLHGPSWWWRLARPKTVELYPALAASTWVLVRGVGRAWTGATDDEEAVDHPLIRFFAAHVWVGLIAIMALPFAYTGTPELRFTARYTAVLHPMGVAVVAAWLAGRVPTVKGRRLRPLLVVVWIAAFLPGQLQMIDLANLKASDRYDGTLIYYAPLMGQEVGPPASRTKLGGASHSFLIGMGLLVKYQQFDYWSWRPPGEARALDHGEMLKRYMELRSDWVSRPDLDRAEFFRGAGYASRIVFGDGGRALLNSTLERFPDDADALLRGWDTTPADLAYLPGVNAWQGEQATVERWTE
jgi:hypothetical protein